MDFDASVVTAIMRRIGWQLTLGDRYLSNPLAGLRKNNLLLTAGLSFKIGGVRGRQVTGGATTGAAVAGRGRL